MQSNAAKGELVVFGIPDIKKIMMAERNECLHTELTAAAREACSPELASTKMDGGFDLGNL